MQLMIHYNEGNIFITFTTMT